MFAGDGKKAAPKARRIAERLNSHATYMSHGRRIGMTELQGMGVKVLDMRTDAVLKELVWDIQYVLDHTFGGTLAIKLVENAHGRCLARIMPMPQLIQVPQQAPQRPGQPPVRPPRQP
jgi:hypothetical protein